MKKIPEVITYEELLDFHKVKECWVCVKPLKECTCNETPYDDKDLSHIPSPF